LNIELLTLSEIESVEGEKGNFTVTVKKNPRFIDEEKCIACGLCAEKCPKKIDDEYNEGLNKRKAAYIKYGQTVPLKYAIDPEHCIYQTRGKCGVCQKVCPTGAIDHDMKAEYVNLNVGAVVLSPGFKPFSPRGIDHYGYDEIPDVITSLEYERMLSASGPYMGHIKRLSDGGEPKKIAWIQCVGSRNINCSDNGHCSSVCCMYAIKQAVMTRSHIEGDGGEQAIFYMDMRTYGKEYERYFEESKNKGVRYERARPHTLLKGPDGVGVTMQYTTESGGQTDEYFDLVVLSIGLEAPEDAMDLAGKFGFDLTKFKFAETSSFDPVTTTRDGVYVTGAFHSPKAIPQSVLAASTAAAEVEKDLVESRGTLAQEKTFPQETDITGQDPKIGVFVCSCGSNIAGVVDVKAVTEYAAGLDGVVFTENNMFTCSTDTQDLIAEKIREQGLNRVVVAACTPRTHEPLFQETLQATGLNKYMIEMANIRNQNSWVHSNEPEKATEKAKDQVRMAVAKVRHNHSLEDIEVNVTQRALVVGAGLAGMSAALNLADQGYETMLVEKETHVGGVARDLNETAKGEKIPDKVKELSEKVANNELVTFYPETTLNRVSGSVGSFTGELLCGDDTRTVEFGVCVLATGARAYTPEEYLYGQDERVVTSLEFDELVKNSPEKVRNTGSTVFIQCVGSRDENRPYCSRICCIQSVKKAVMLKKMNPETDVFVLYRDIRTYGESEDLYKQARDLGVIFIRYDLQNKPVVKNNNGNLEVETFDPIVQLPVNIAADRLVLATAIVPNPADSFVNMFKCGVNADGFLTEAHPKLRPVDSNVDGVFLAGMCHYPKPVNESIAQGRAAASRASVILNKRHLKLDAIKSHVTHNCDGCALCLDICPYNAITLTEYEENGRMHRRIKTDKALCKGCGLCAATCPKEGVQVNGFTNTQIKAQVETILSGS